VSAALALRRELKLFSLLTGEIRLRGKGRGQGLR
jgi:hypothetical protein